MVSRNIPHEYFLLQDTLGEGQIIGQLRGKAISASVVDSSGRRYRFVGLMRRDRAGRLDVLSLKQGEWVVLPNLIYEMA